ncbi:hypothetical protein SH1V18_42400 [Vallitalea longa]|uniref:O-antigen ligase-related domain-containing protein n=1 Tax=Vallitalea longa TaxID=2936439 RepID=A0A9W5YFV9_9FIRM|nr:O-antigen ligase family protein [Vallitalea longa]GKX31760.1 hypothetical protein SH1V18_42400 [Vallitalea longa]
MKKTIKTTHTYTIEFLLTIILLFTMYTDMTTQGIYYSKFVIIGITLLICGIKYKKIYYDKSIYIYFLFLVVVCASGIYGIRNDVFVGNIITLICCLVLLIIIPLIINTQQRLDIFMICIILFGFIMSIYSISLTDFNRLMEGTYYASNVLLKKIGNRNAVAMLIGFSFNMSVYRLLYKKEYKNIFCLVVMFLAILLTGSRKGVIFCVIPISLNLFIIILNTKKIKKKIRYLIMFVFLFITTYYALFNIDFLYNNIGWRIDSIFKNIFFNEVSLEGSFNVRKTMIKLGLEYFKERPIFGHGIENFRYLYGWQSGHETYSHNNYIELLVDNGLVGFLLYYLFYISIIIKTNINRIKSKIKNEKDYYVFCISLLLCMLIIDWGLISYKWYPNYLMLALALIKTKSSVK